MGWRVCDSSAFYPRAGIDFWVHENRTVHTQKVSLTHGEVVSSRWLGKESLLYSTLPALFSSETNPVPIYAEHSWRSKQEREGGRVEWPHTRRTFFDSTNEGFLPRVFSLINLIEPYFQYLHCHSAVTEIATTTTGEENPCVTNKRGINNGSGPCTCAPSMAGSRSSHLLSLKSDTCNKQIPFEIPQILSLIFSVPITRPPNLYTRRRRHGSVSHCRQTGSVNQGWDGMLWCWRYSSVMIFKSDCINERRRPRSWSRLPPTVISGRVACTSFIVFHCSGVERVVAKLLFIFGIYFAPECTLFSF